MCTGVCLNRVTFVPRSAAAGGRAVARLTIFCNTAVRSSGVTDARTVRLYALCLPSITSYASRARRTSARAAC